MRSSAVQTIYETPLTRSTFLQTPPPSPRAGCLVGVVPERGVGRADRQGEEALVQRHGLSGELVDEAASLHLGTPLAPEARFDTTGEGRMYYALRIRYFLSLSTFGSLGSGAGAAV